MTYNYYQGVASAKANRIGLAVMALFSALVLSLGMFAAVFAQTTGNYSLFGSASQEADGVHLVSNETESFSGVSFEVEPGAVVSALDSLAATYEAVVGDCGGGAPRFQVNTTEGNVFVYLGDAPNFQTCDGGSTGNLIDDEDLRVDASQVGGSQYDTWADVEELIGDEEITNLLLIVDGGFTGDQEFAFSSAQVNETSYDFTKPGNKDQCKDGGYENFGYKNQGQCVADVQSSSNSKHHRE